MTRLMFVDGLLRVVTAAAPELDWSGPRRVKAHLKRIAGRAIPRERQGVSSQAGCCFRPASVMPSRKPTPRRPHIVALLALMPMRRRALAGLALGTSLIVRPDGFTVVLPEELTKTSLPWEADVPEPVAGLLRRYLAETRPFLAARGRQCHDMLWVGDDGRPMSYAHIGPKISGITERLTGKRIPPHFLRDSAATTLARESPEAARLVRPVLAHASLGTAGRHYIHARSMEAGRVYARLLKDVREES